MGKKKELKKLKKLSKRVNALEDTVQEHVAKTSKQFDSIEALLTDFNEKLTAVLTIRAKSPNGVHTTPGKKVVKKK
ncbi:MAG: hypothetical protein JST49_08775 [Bacteroidetes bacterium]|nr:hypothetical protein [Bacteroidota bacterium]